MRENYRGLEKVPNSQNFPKSPLKFIDFLNPVYFFKLFSWFSTNINEITM